MAHVLVVEDNADQLELRRMLLEMEGHTVALASDAASAARKFDEEKPRMVLMDLRLPNPEDGRALIRHVRANNDPEVKLVVLSGYPQDLERAPEARMVDELLTKPVASARLMRMIARLVVSVFVFVGMVGAADAAIGDYSFQLDAPAEVVAEIDATVPGADWGRAGRESVLLTMNVGETRKQHIMLYAGSQRARYRVFLGPLLAGAHQVKLEKHPDWSARGLQPQIHSVEYRQFKPGDADYEMVAHAPVVFARGNTVGKFSDIPLLTFCERLGDGSLRYSVIFSNEDGGTSTRGLMARWGRATDIEHVYHVWPKDNRALIQTRDHKDVPFAGRKDGEHPLLAVVTDNNMVAGDATSPVRYQPAPVMVDLSRASRELVMDQHPLTYLISARELEREGKLRAFDALEGNKISAPENYLYVELLSIQKAARLAVWVRLEGESVWRSSHLGLHSMAIERSGWMRTAVELPPATQPTQVAEVALACLNEERSEAPGSCRVESVSRVFFLDAQQRPSESFYNPPQGYRGPFVIPGGQMRVVRLR